MEAGTETAAEGEARARGGANTTPARTLPQVPEANAARGFPFFFGDRGYTLLNVDGELHCIEANSTAWGYPTIDVKVLRDRGSAGLAVEVPLDGTVYDLVTGEVLEWCPSDGGDGMGGLLRKGLAVLKKDETPKAIGGACARAPAHAGAGACACARSGADMPAL